MEFASWVSAELQDSARTIVAELDPAERQIVIDEWAGCMAAASLPAKRGSDAAVIGAQVLTAPGNSWTERECQPDYGVKKRT